MKNSMNKISVVIPIYNEEDGIQSTLDFLIRNLLKNNICNEIILVNDGSTDKTAKIIENFIKDDNNPL